MPNRTDLQQSLGRWAELEPERCLVAPPTGLVGADVWLGDDFSFVMFDGPSPEQLADLLAAVIEAVEARSWEWSVWGDGKEREAAVYVPPSDPKQPRSVYATGLTTALPAAALLSAFLAALEAETNQ